MAAPGANRLAGREQSSLLPPAGVPLKQSVAGVAMGLIMEADGQFVILTDILGSEDALGDMDFKVAGTADGVTAFQMDIKARATPERTTPKGPPPDVGRPPAHLASRQESPRLTLRTVADALHASRVWTASS